MGRRSFFGKIAARCLVLGCTSALVGCAANWHANYKEYSDPYEHGDYAVATQQVAHVADTGVDTDKVLLRLEEGAILRTAGDLSASNTAFDQADQLVGDYQQWPNVRLSEEAGAALTTVRSINYRGNLSDLVMLNTYRALNYLELGNPDGARSMLIRAGFVQQDIADKYAKELQKSQEDLDKKKAEAKEKNTVDSDAQNPDIQKKVKGEDPDLAHVQAYSNYVNPFCDYMQGIFFMAYGADRSDRERSVTAFRRAASMVKDNPYIAQDLADAGKIADGKKVAPTTYVIFETGNSVERSQIEVPVLLGLISRDAPNVIVYFPVLRSRHEYIPTLWAAGGGTTAKTAVVSNMDAVLVQEFNNQLPQIITRIIIGVATKAAIDAGGSEALKGQNVFVQLGFKAGSLLYQHAMNQSDLRTWRSLPKSFQVARLPTPKDGKLTLSAGGVPSVEVNVVPGKINIVYVKSVHQYLPLVVRDPIVNHPGKAAAKVAAITPATPTVNN
jgi:hypothetical protein